MRSRSTALAQWVLFVVLALGLGGCAGLSSVLNTSPDPGTRLAPPPSPTDPVETAKSAEEPVSVLHMEIAQKAPSQGPPEVEIEEYDP